MRFYVEGGIKDLLKRKGRDDVIVNFLSISCLSLIFSNKLFYNH